MDWKIKIVNEIQKIIDHGWGGLEVNISREKEYKRITIKAGRYWVFKEKT